MKQTHQLTGNKIQTRIDRTLFTSLLAVLLLLVLASSVSALARPRPIVSDFAVIDGTPTPGQNFTLAIKVENADVVCAMSTIVSVKPSAPLSVQIATNAPPVNVCNGQTQTVLIPMHIDATAVGGTYQLPVTLDYEDTLNTPYTSTDTLSFTILGVPDLQAHITSTQPIDVYPGDVANVNIQIENDGTYAAQNIKATLSSLPSDPIEVKPATSVATIATLDAKRNVVETFSVEIPKNAPAHDYALQLAVQYLDQNRDAKLKTMTIMLPVKKRAMFDVVQMPGRGLFANDNNEVVKFNITNSGTDTAYDVKLKVAPQYPFTTDGSVRYIKSLAPGQSVPVEFVFTVDKDGTVGGYGLSMIVDFNDALDKSMHDTVDMPMVVRQKGFLRVLFIDLWYLWALAIIVMAVIVIRRKKKVAADKAKKKD